MANYRCDDAIAVLLPSQQRVIAVITGGFMFNSLMARAAIYWAKRLVCQKSTFLTNKAPSPVQKSFRAKVASIPDINGAYDSAMSSIPNNPHQSLGQTPAGVPALSLLAAIFGVAAGFHVETGYHGPRHLVARP